MVREKWTGRWKVVNVVFKGLIAVTEIERRKTKTTIVFHGISETIVYAVSWLETPNIR